MLSMTCVSKPFTARIGGLSKVAASSISDLR